MNRSVELGCPIAVGASGVAKRLAAIERHWPLRGERLLDVGCGNGAYTTTMASGFDEVVGIEVEPGRLGEFRDRIAGTQHNISLHEMSAEDMQFPSAHFDVVTAIEVIEHIERLDIALDEIHRVLKPGGALCITCPNRLFPFETHQFRVPGTQRLVKGTYWPFLPYVPPLHRRYATARNYRPHELRELMARHALHEYAVDYVMPPFDRWRIGRKWIRPFTERLEHTRFKLLGVSIVGIYVKR